MYCLRNPNSDPLNIKKKLYFRGYNSRANYAVVLSNNLIKIYFLESKSLQFEPRKFKR